MHRLAVQRVGLQAVKASDGAPKEIAFDEKPPDLKEPKFGQEDNKEHHGGNRWAGGTGGASTAGAYFRLYLCTF